MKDSWDRNTHQNGWQKKIVSTKSIRIEGQWVIHLLLQHNYLFFYPSFTSLLIWDNDVPAKQKNTLFVIIQIKHWFLRENVCQTTMRQSYYAPKTNSPKAKWGKLY